MEGAASTEATFRYFLEWCEQQNSTFYPLAHQTKTPEEQWTQLLHKAAAASPTALQTTLTIAWSAMYSLAEPPAMEVGFQYLAGQIYNASLESNAPKSVAGIGSATSPYNTSSAYAETAISCADQAHSDTSYVDWQYKKLIAQSEAPLMQGFSAQASFQLVCAGLPPPSRNPPHPIYIPQSKELPMICKSTSWKSLRTRRVSHGKGTGGNDSPLCAADCLEDIPRVPRPCARCSTIWM